MATSGSVDYNQTRLEIIEDALTYCNVLGVGENLAAEDDAFAGRQLNRMLKTWQADGIHLWTRREAFLFPQKGQAAYKFGPNSTDHAAEIDDAVKTELAADAASGAGSITVDDATDIAASDNIGVVLDDDTVQWLTVSSLSGSTITLSGTLTGAASTDQPVFAYTTKINRPLRIIDVQRRDKSDQATPIITVSHEEYQRLPNKTSQGKSNEAYYHPQIPDGVFYLWPVPDTAADRFRMTCLFPIEDMDVSSNEPDLPQEWLDAMVWGLAARLAPAYGIRDPLYTQLVSRAEQTYQTVLFWDAEPESLYMQPNMTHGFGG